jgi:hypothetical protein
MKRNFQTGVTLVVSLIMLVVLTLMVISSIRFGNINLKVANNAQIDAEAQAASLTAIEKMLVEIDAADKIDDVAAMNNQTISTGGTSYQVSVSKPACIMTRYLMSTELKPRTNPEDRACFGGGGADQIISATGTIVAQPTECKSQQWETTAAIADASSGANMTMVQGVSARVSLEVQCP